MSEYTPESVTPLPGGEQRIYKFSNGYGAQVSRSETSYGNENGEGLWELGVLGPDGQLTYTTPITTGVLPYLSDADVAALLDEIAALPPGLDK